MAGEVRSWLNGPPHIARLARDALELEKLAAQVSLEPARASLLARAGDLRLQAERLYQAEVGPLLR